MHDTNLRAFFIGLLAGGTKYILDIGFSQGFLMKIVEGCITAVLFGASGVIGKYLGIWMKNKMLPWMQKQTWFK
jgi:hypothetical protein